MNEMVTTSLQEMSYEDYMAKQSVMDEVTGELPDSEFGRLPMLKVNYEADWVSKDSEGNEVGDPISLPRGQYTITVKDEDSFVRVYGKEATLRPYVRANRYQAFVNGEGYKLNSTIFRSWSEPVLDDLGGEWVANKYKKSSVKVYEDIAEIIKCQHVIFGTATIMDAKDMNGKEYLVEDVPCMFIAKGSNYNAFNELFNEVKQKGKFINYTMNLPKPKRETDDTGSVTYFTMHPNWQSEKYSVKEKDFYILKDMVLALEEQNDMVLKKYQKVHDGQSTKEEKETLKSVSGEDLSNDFDDAVDVEYSDVTINETGVVEELNDAPFDVDNKTMAG